MDKVEAVKICEKILAYDFDDPSLLVQALTHPSGAKTPEDSYERLEFLGDAVLGYVICELLFKKYPNRNEGVLTKIKSAVVSRETCYRIAQNLKLHKVMLVGRGVLREKLPPSILANAVESVIAALYLDGGIKIARRFILQHFSPEVVKLSESITYDNYKSMLQDRVQKEFGAIPEYLILDEQGPDHCKCFKVSVKINGQYFPPAWGNTKKNAEQHAAENALCSLQSEQVPYAYD
ncbi:MAG: ribonuclease III [Planctomycetaceae bacterium]|jgi:ribonuclease-3|nr:ribonuclease III [Planctomycetaceae bacterium]